MDSYEASKVVMSRIQTLDPENASKIMGYILLQDEADKEMIRLAFGPESLIHSNISRAKACLGIPPAKPAGPFSQTSPRININIPNSGFYFSNTSPSLVSPAAAFGRTSPRPFSYGPALGDDSARLSLLDEELSAGPRGRIYSPVFPYGDDAGEQSQHPFHRRSSSVNDPSTFLEAGGNGGWKPCMYFARGFCKNGGSCKFSHGSDFGDEAVGSPGKNACGFDELSRMKVLQQQQRFAAMGGRGGFGYSSKCMDFTNDNTRNEISQMGFISGGSNSSARQIYLTFPSDSTFMEEDVSNYFSMFGPVHDVRIPYQQQRMFGFVTFVYAETVNLILAKGNPHFVCNSRVLVKPYKDKGKIPDKKQYQHMDKGDYLSCLSPSAHPIDLPFGSGMLFDTREMMLRRKLEQEVELHHAIERRMMNLQLMELKNQHHTSNHFFHSFQGPSVPISSPIQADQLLTRQNFISSINNTNAEDSDDFDRSQEAIKSPPISTDQSLLIEGIGSNTNNNGSDLPENLEHNLPDNLFASPTKLGGEHKSIFSQASASTDDNIPKIITSSSS